MRKLRGSPAGSRSDEASVAVLAEGCSCAIERFAEIVNKSRGVHSRMTTMIPTRVLYLVLSRLSAGSVPFNKLLRTPTFR